MTALAEALLAAQRQAIGALSKAYVAQTLREDGATTVPEAFRRALDRIGATDAVDQAQLLAALDVLVAYGAPAPRATQPVTPESRKAEAASDAQMGLLRRVAEERGFIPPEYQLTKEDASKIIDEMKAGTYNADNYTVPF